MCTAYMYSNQLTDFISQTPDPPNLSSMIDGLYNRRIKIQKTIVLQLQVQSVSKGMTTYNDLYKHNYFVYSFQPRDHLSILHACG